MEGSESVSCNADQSMFLLGAGRSFGARASLAQCHLLIGGGSQGREKGRRRRRRRNRMTTEQTPQEC